MRLSLRLLRRWRYIRLVLSIPFLFASFLLGWMFTIQLVSTVDQTQPADVILLLGAGVNYDGSPSPVLEARIEQAAALYHAGYAPLIAVTGGSIRGLPTEAGSAQRELIQRGVPAEAILIEETSQNTVQNIANISPLLRTNNVESVLLVSSSFHMWRGSLIAQRAGFTVYLAPTSHSSEYLPMRRAYLLFREVGAASLYLLLGI